MSTGDTVRSSSADAASSSARLTSFGNVEFFRGSSLGSEPGGRRRRGMRQPCVESQHTRFVERTEHVGLFELSPIPPGSQGPAEVVCHGPKAGSSGRPPPDTLVGFELASPLAGKPAVPANAGSIASLRTVWASALSGVSPFVRWPEASTAGDDILATAPCVSAALTGGSSPWLANCDADCGRTASVVLALADRSSTLTLERASFCTFSGISATPSYNRLLAWVGISPGGCKAGRDAAPADRAAAQSPGVSMGKGGSRVFSSEAGTGREHCTVDEERVWGRAGMGSALSAGLAAEYFKTVPTTSTPLAGVGGGCKACMPAVVAVSQGGCRLDMADRLKEVSL